MGVRLWAGLIKAWHGLIKGSSYALGFMRILLHQSHTFKQKETKPPCLHRKWKLDPLLLAILVKFVHKLTDLGMAGTVWYFCLYSPALGLKTGTH